jgi:hypothetical protein
MKQTIRPESTAAQVQQQQTPFRNHPQLVGSLNSGLQRLAEGQYSATKIQKQIT